MPLEDITQLINEKAESCRDVIAGIFRVEEEFIEAIRRRRNQFTMKFTMGKVNEEGIRCIQKIYKEKNFYAITGQQAKEICNDLQPEEGGVLIKNHKERLDQYVKKLEKQLEKVYLLREKAFTTENYQIDSKVLELKGTVTKDLEFINKALNNPKQIELIFRGSEHGFRASEFHRLCDNTEDTFVLVRTEFGRTVAGYTHYKWNEMPNGNYVKDSARRAFLLLLDLQEKLVPIKDDQLICNLTTYGPIFGGGCDFVITDNCNTNCSGCNVGNTYNHEGTNKYVLEHPTTYAAICGRPQSGDFKVVQYQVFKVSWK